MMKLIFLLLLLALSFTATAQFNPAWGGKKAAVVITYDDAIDQHLDNAAPLLDSLGLQASFYITAFSPSVQRRMEEWKNLSNSGHELGNHTLFHPCVGNQPGREFVSADYDLSRYTIKRIQDEARMTNLFLQALDGKKQRTFAFTCGDMKVQDSSFMPSMRDDFVAARAVRNQMHKIHEVDLYNMDCYMVQNHTGEQMIEWVKQAMASQSLLVILFHGVGGGNGLDVSIEAHRELLLYLKANEKDLMIAPLRETAIHIREWQKRDRAFRQQFEPVAAMGFPGTARAGSHQNLRGIFGKRIENPATSAEYHWFAGNFIQYAGPPRPNDLPVGAKSIFPGGLQAGPVYQHEGTKGPASPDYPPE